MKNFRRRWSWLVVAVLTLFPCTVRAVASHSTVAVITNETGAHLGAYFQSLAQAPEVGRVVLADPDGNAEASARELLGEKLTAVYPHQEALYAAETPVMALITMEARTAPAAIRAASSKYGEPRGGLRSPRTVPARCVGSARRALPR